MAQHVVKAVAVLPATREALLAQRVPTRPLPLSYAIEPLHVELYEQPAYRELMKATTNAAAKEGSMDADDWAATVMLRDRAAECNRPEIASQTLKALKRALKACMRRFRLSRTGRAEAIHEQLLAATGAAD